MGLDDLPRLSGRELVAATVRRRVVAGASAECGCATVGRMQTHPAHSQRRRENPANCGDTNSWPAARTDRPVPARPEHHAETLAATDWIASLESSCWFLLTNVFSDLADATPKCCHTANVLVSRRVEKWMPLTVVVQRPVSTGFTPVD